MSYIQLMPDYLPMNKIQIEISCYDSNKWICAPKPIKPHHIKVYINDYKAVEREIAPLPLSSPKNSKDKEIKKHVLKRSIFGCHKVPVEMDERIIESGLKVLESNQQEAKKQLKKKAKRELEKKKQFYLDENREELNQQGLKMDKIEEKMEKKFEQMMNQMQTWMNHQN
jgi:hypothetical protein